MVDSTGTSTWTYDNASRVTALTTPEGNLTYGYDNDNRRTSLVDGSGTTSYAYDNDARQTSLTNAFSETTSWTFDNASRPTQQTFANGAYTAYTYDTRNRPLTLTHYDGLGGTISAESYVYDGVGNLSSKTVDGLTTTYGYDNSDQITSESNTGYSASYTYDHNGNRLTKVLGGVTDTYTYDTADKLQSTSSKTYGYDAAGRTTTVTTGAGTTTLSYDYESRVTSITLPSSVSDTFTYNGIDTRVGKSDSTGTYSYERDGVGVTAPVLNDTAAEYTPGVSESRSGTSAFYHADRLGSTTKISNSSASVTDTRQFDAFGMLVSSTGTNPTPFGFVGNEGYQSDPDSGLMLLGHRYCDSSTGRFLTRDPVEDGRNWYDYCDNGPQKYIDANGLQENKRDTGLRPLSDQDIQAELNNLQKAKLTPEEKAWRQRLQTEQKARNNRHRRRPDKFQLPVLDPVKVKEGVTTVSTWVIVGVVLWEIGKWGVAAATAVPTGGGSLIGAGALP
jgi:RHS repeat-associated protein